jgi:imidazolonepropionase-like amidohydrolase
LVMDIYDDECIQADGKKGTMPQDFLEHDRDLGGVQRENFRKAVKAGVKLAFGTDAGVCAYGTSAKQFAFMVKYGMTPMQAIQSATSEAADLIGRSSQFGSVKPGKYADVVAVAGDPLKDISVLENVQFAMKDGVVYKQNGKSF